MVIACLIGSQIGILAVGNERLHRFIHAFIDKLQTLPSFVYLMPEVMLFRVGDFAAMLAVIAYAVAPAIRYTDHGIGKVPSQLMKLLSHPVVHLAKFFGKYVCPWRCQKSCWVLTRPS